MDASATLLRPRLRLFRRSPSPRPQDSSAEATPQAAPRSLFSAFHDEEDEFPTPRVQPKPIASLGPEPTPKSFPSSTSATAVPTDTPAARLRALLAREPRSPRSTTPPPAPSSEADSAAEPARFGSSTSSVTRESLKDIFSRALREPGNTPQKGRPRRNSFDGSSMEITPVVERDRGKRRAARRSLSDEEAEKPTPESNRQFDPSIRSSTAVTFDTLRARLTSSQSQLMDQDTPVSLYDHSSKAFTSTSNSQYHPHAATSSSQFTSTRVTPSVSAGTPHPSFQMSSQLAFQSNLLDQDSEMQRAMGEVLNSESEASVSNADVAQPAAIPSDSRRSSSLRGSKNGSKLESRRISYELDSSTSPVNGRTNKIHRSQEEEHIQQREREWNRPGLPSRSNTPEIHRRHSQEFHRRLSQEFRSPSHTKSFSHESAVSQSSAARPAHKTLERRGSLASIRSFDDDRSSRPSSLSSQADYRDRISELDQERNHEREREWNKRHPPSRPSSSLSTSSNHSFSRSHSHPPRSPSATPYLAPTHTSLQRQSSRTSLRSDSPASFASSRDSSKEWELEEQKETAHERERNWNSPHPHWSAAKSPSPSHLKIRNNANTTLRATSSLTHLRDSNGNQDAFRASSKLQSSSSAPSTLLPKSGDRSDPGLDQRATQSETLNGSSPDKTPGTASKFGWNFARSPLPPLELDVSADRRRTISSPASGSQSTDRAIISSQIPVRSRVKSFSSVGHAISDMSFTNVVGDESSFEQDHQNGPSEVVEPSAGKPWSQEDMILASDEESIVGLPPQSTTPKSNPPNSFPEDVETDVETEILTSPSLQGSPRLGAPADIPSETSLQEVNDPPRFPTPNPPPEEPPVSATPPGTPPPASTGPHLSTSEISSSFALVTPPRQTSFGSSILDFRTPSPPHDLPDLPGPPSSSDDDAPGDTPIKDRRVDANSNFTLTKTPKPPGAWAATPLPPKFHRSPSPATLFPLESTPPTSTSTPLPRANSLPPTRTGVEADSPDDDGLLTPVGSLLRGRSLPLRTPAPPGAWLATPGQSALLSNGADQSQFGSLGRRKGLKVRFDVAESEASATEGHPTSPTSAIRLTNPELPIPKLSTDRGTEDSVEVVVNEVPRPTSIPHRPTTPERPTTPTPRENGPSSWSPRSPRRSPAVRLVDAYGRERVDAEGTAEPLMDPPNGYADAERKTTTPLSTPRRSLVRIVDAMGREVDDGVDIPDISQGKANRSLETDISTVSDDTPVGHAEALACMRKKLRDLAESLSDTDRSEDLDLNSSHLEQLEEVSNVARLARNQLAHNLRLETAKEHDLRSNSKISAWTRGVLPGTTKTSWNTTVVYCGILIQLLLVLLMWRYAHTEARRLFYTTYYNPLYPEFTPIQGSSCFSGTLSTTSRSWTMLDSYETIRREGLWSIGKEVSRALRHIGDQAWERWGERAHLEKPT